MNSSASFNPDFPGTDGMSFVWYCRDADESEFFSFNLTHESLVSPNHFNSTLPANEVSKQKIYCVILRFSVDFINNTFNAVAEPA